MIAHHAASALTSKQRTLIALHAIGAYKRCPLCGSELYESWHHDRCSAASCPFGSLDETR